MNPVFGAADTSEQMQDDWFDFPINPLDEVIPGLWQASSELDPPELFAQGFDAIFDLCGWSRGDGVPDRPYTFYLIDDVPWAPIRRRSTRWGSRWRHASEPASAWS